MNRLMAYRITLHIFLMFQFFSIAVDSFADSIDDSGKIKGLNQGDVEKGNEHGKLGSYMEAIKDYDKAVELNPQDSRAYYNRSLMYAELSKYQQVLRDLNRAIELDPKFAKAYNERGKTRGKLGNYQEAIKDFSKAVDLDPQDAKAYYNRGVIYNNLGNQQQAIQDLKAAARLGLISAQNALKRQGIAW